MYENPTFGTKIHLGLNNLVCCIQFGCSSAPLSTAIPPPPHLSHPAFPSPVVALHLSRSSFYLCAVPSAPALFSPQSLLPVRAPHVQYCTASTHSRISSHIHFLSFRSIPCHSIPHVFCFSRIAR